MGTCKPSWVSNGLSVIGRLTWRHPARLVWLYLLAIVAANLAVAKWGPVVSVVTAFLLIGLDLTTRDALHDAWQKHRALKLGALIVTGSVVTWLLNRNADRVALASVVAFAAAMTVDAVVYQCLGKRSRMVRVNGSNIPSAVVDSLLFPTIAFGALLPLVTLGQIAAKVVGGFLWSLVLRRKLRPASHRGPHRACGLEWGEAKRRAAKGET